MEDQVRTYQTFKMQDFARQPEWLLMQVDYLQEMFELQVENQRGKPIVICLREKATHFSERQQKGDGIFRDGPADNVKYLGMTENGTQFTP